MADYDRGQKTGKWSEYASILSKAPVGPKNTYDQTFKGHETIIDNALNFINVILWRNIKGTQKVFIGLGKLNINAALDKLKEADNIDDKKEKNDS